MYSMANSMSTSPSVLDCLALCSFLLHHLFLVPGLTLLFRLCFGEVVVGGFVPRFWPLFSRLLHSNFEFGALKYGLLAYKKIK